MDHEKRSIKGGKTTFKRSNIICQKRKDHKLKRRKTHTASG